MLRKRKDNQWHAADTLALKKPAKLAGVPYVKGIIACPLMAISGHF